MSELTCPICGMPADGLLSAVVGNEYVSERCEKCASQGSALYSNKYRRDRDREDHRKDILQLGDEGFIREYPEAASAKGYSDEQIRKYS